MCTVMSWQGWEDAEILGASTWCLQTRNQGDGSVSCWVCLFTLYIWKPEKLPVGSFMDPKSHCETDLSQDSIYHLTPYVYTNSAAFHLWVSVLRVTLPKALGISGYPPPPGYLNWWTLTLEEGSAATGSILTRLFLQAAGSGSEKWFRSGNRQRAMTFYRGGWPQSSHQLQALDFPF